MKIAGKNTVYMLLTTVFVFSLFFGSVFAQDLQQARNLTLSEKFEDADAAYQAVIQKEPSNGDAYYYYGENILKAYNADPFSNTKADVVKEAREVFLKGVKNDSLNRINSIGLGMLILFEKNDTSAADVYFRLAEMGIPKKAKKIGPKDQTLLVLLATAQTYAKDKRLNKSLAYLDKAKEANEKNPDIFIGYGEVYLESNNASLAVTNYNRALYINPKLPMPQVAIGNQYLRSRNLNEARVYFEKAIAIDSTFAPAYKGLGEVFSMGGLYKFSKDNYKKFLDLSGNNTPAKVSYVNSLFQSKDYDNALALIDEILTVDKNRNYLNRIAAYSCYEKKPADYTRGLNYIETFFKNASPEKVIIKDYIYYGRIMTKMKEDSAMVDKGFEKLVYAYSLDTTDYDLLTEIASSAYYAKRYDVSASMYSKKAALGKASISDYMTWGKAYYQAKQYGKADTVFTKVSQLEPDNMQAYVWIANTYASMDPDSKAGLAKPKYDVVLQKAYQDTSKYIKEIFDAYSYFGSYYLFSKPDYDRAINYYQKIIDLDPKNAKWQLKGYQSLAIIYTRMKAYPQAKAAYQKVLSLDPNNKDAQAAIKNINDILIMKQYE
jgi:tetratricopeptide (TPR) repeat protein